MDNRHRFPCQREAMLEEVAADKRRRQHRSRRAGLAVARCAQRLPPFGRRLRNHNRNRNPGRSRARHNRSPIPAGALSNLRPLLILQSRM